MGALPPPWPPPDLSGFHSLFPSLASLVFLFSFPLQQVELFPKTVTFPHFLCPASAEWFRKPKPGADTETMSTKGWCGVAQDPYIWQKHQFSVSSAPQWCWRPGNDPAAAGEAGGGSLCWQAPGLWPLCSQLHARDLSFGNRQQPPERDWWHMDFIHSANEGKARCGCMGLELFMHSSLQGTSISGDIDRKIRIRIWGFSQLQGNGEQSDLAFPSQPTTPARMEVSCCCCLHPKAATNPWVTKVPSKRSSSTFQSNASKKCSQENPDSFFYPQISSGCNCFPTYSSLSDVTHQWDSTVHEQNY